jgi:hypothetical protein
LTEIKIESIQNSEWIPKLAEKGWRIEDHGGIHHAVMNGGTRKRKSRKSRSKR